MADISSPEGTEPNGSTAYAWAALPSGDTSTVFPWNALWEAGNQIGAGGTGLTIVLGRFKYGAAIGGGGRLVAFTN